MGHTVELGKSISQWPTTLVHVDHTFAQYIGAIARTAMSKRGTVADWKKEVPRLYDACMVIQARWGAAPLATLAGRMYEQRGVGGKRTFDFDSLILPLPHWRRVHISLMRSIVPIQDIVDSRALLRFLSVGAAASRRSYLNDSECY